MSKAVFLLGTADAVFHAITNRLIRAGATIVTVAEAADVVMSIGELVNSADISVIPAESDIDEPAEVTEDGPNTIVRVHDLLVPEGVIGWGGEVLYEWVDWVKEGAEGVAPPDIEARHWVHIRDAADAVTLLALADADVISQGVIDLAGRRAWSAEAVLHEMGMLWNRYTDALGLTHTIESLSRITSPASYQFTGIIERPDLSPLHDTLKAIGIEEGWHPLTAMRVGLMELFAHSEIE
tara:strand:- start:1820 stop:2533 length:714 start_codon:yes stop_codon:yes gene_type:complete